MCANKRLQLLIHVYLPTAMFMIQYTAFPWKITVLCLPIASPIPLKVILHWTIRNDNCWRNTVSQCWNNVVTIRNNVATLCCAKNRHCESSRVTSPQNKFIAYFQYSQFYLTPSPPLNSELHGPRSSSFAPFLSNTHIMVLVLNLFHLLELLMYL